MKWVSFALNWVETFSALNQTLLGRHLKDGRLLPITTAMIPMLTRQWMFYLCTNVDISQGGLYFHVYVCLQALKIFHCMMCGKFFSTTHFLVNTFYVIHKHLIQVRSVLILWLKESRKEDVSIDFREPIKVSNTVLFYMLNIFLGSHYSDHVCFYQLIYNDDRSKNLCFHLHVTSLAVKFQQIIMMKS